ncbi:hypothetical protein BDW02DRAFT_607851 [Decorospora gaudefroyi]|uniref:Uncharacterized protein n=1 Tax=Decorospora gaudefroyi TaxID=184978 RepID=A0A6A5K0L5_9PLEO|nr:hypothetical protein BDW02DRAFT_607851 [Decorospora gaudefroyi]
MSNPNPTSNPTPTTANTSTSNSNSNSIPNPTSATTTSTSPTPKLGPICTCPPWISRSKWRIVRCHNHPPPCPFPALIPWEKMKPLFGVAGQTEGGREDESEGEEEEEEDKSESEEEEEKNTVCGEKEGKN